jgi:Nucleotidyl transferase AbiEii toxin, Type IV TA system
VSWPWRSPEATRQALTARTRARQPQERRGQRLREIAYRRLLARIFATQPERWVVKGGVALLLRLDPNRTSNDIDLVYVAQGGEHALALKALDEAAAHDLGDFFEFEIGRHQTEEVDPDHPLQRARSVPVLARIGATTFSEFTIDLALPREDDVEIEWVQPEATLTGEPAVDQTVPLALLALPAQIADKVCALHERHGAGHYSSRARDLADLAMIAQQKDLEGSRLIGCVRREEARRRQAGTLIGPPPTRLQLAKEQIADWSARWKRATRDAPVTFEEARAVAAAFLNPVLDGTADGMHWNAATQTWS